MIVFPKYHNYYKYFRITGQGVFYIRMAKQIIGINIGDWGSLQGVGSDRLYINGFGNK